MLLSVSVLLMTASQQICLKLTCCSVLYHEQPYFVAASIETAHVLSLDQAGATTVYGASSVIAGFSGRVSV